MRVMVTLGIMISAASVAYAGEPTVQQILDRVAEKYKAMQTYQCEGSVVGEGTNGDKARIETSFSMKLRKGNLYLITWSKKLTKRKDAVLSGAVWNTGAQPFFSSGVPAKQLCFKMPDDTTALAYAAAESHGAAGRIPALFFSATIPNLDSSFHLYALKLEPSAKLDGEDCYVIRGSALEAIRVTLWISRQDYLIRQYINSGGSAADVAAEAQQMTDQQLEQALKEMGLPSTPEDRAKTREQMKKDAEAMERMKMSGWSDEEHYTGISSPELKPADFEFKLPEDSVVQPCPYPSLLQKAPSTAK
jgi:hypothetical protein